MRTAFFVYQPAVIRFSTSESGLELCGMNVAVVPLHSGPNELQLAPGVYKIDSSQELDVDRNDALFELASATKNNDPRLQLTSRARSCFASFDAAALDAFLSTADAKQVSNP